MDREIPGLAGGSRTPPASPTDGVAPCNPRTNPAPARWTPTAASPGSAPRRRTRRPPLPPPRPACAGAPWRTWLLLSWAICTLASPTFAFVVVLLCIDARSDNPYFWWSLPLIVAAGNAVAILRTHYRHGRRGYADRAALARQHAATAQATAGALFLAAGAASGCCRNWPPCCWAHGTPDRPPWAGSRSPWDSGWPRMCMPERCMPGWPFANRPPPCQRRPARADGGSTPPGHRRPARLVRGSTPPSGRRRACAQRTAAPPLAGAQARTRAPHCPQKLAAGASVARHCTHAAGVSDAPHCAQNRPPAACAAPQRRRQARPGGVEDSGSDHRRIRSGRAGCRVNRSRDGCHGRLPTDASVCPCRTPNRLAALTCA